MSEIEPVRVAIDKLPTGPTGPSKKQQLAKSILVAAGSAVVDALADWWLRRKDRREKGKE